jgi:hypothetical protein
MQSKHFRQGGITDSWEQGTPAQRPKGAIAFGGDTWESNPGVTMRRGNGPMRFGTQTGPSQLRFGSIRQDVLREGVFLSWTETFLDDYDVGRIPEPSISAEEAERVKEINAQRKTRRQDSSGASSYRGARMTQADLASVVSRSDRGPVHQGGSGVEGAEEGVAYQEVEAIHHDELRPREDSGRIGEREEPWRGGEDHERAREYSRVGRGAPPPRAYGGKRRDQGHDD